MLPLADRVVELVPQFGQAEIEPEVVDLAAGEELFAQGSFGELIYMRDFAVARSRSCASSKAARGNHARR